MGIDHNTLEQKKQWEQTRQTIMSQEIDDIFQVRHEYELLDADQMETKRTKQQIRLMGMKQSSEIALPKYQAKESLYTDTPAPAFKSSKKRQKEINKEGTVLNQRMQNRALIGQSENLLKLRQTQLDQNVYNAARLSQYQFSMRDRRAFLGFTENKNRDELVDMIAKYKQGGDVQLRIVAECMREFMKTDLSTIKIGNDEQIANSSEQLVRLREQTESIKTMLEDSPNFWNSMDPDAKELYDVKLEEAEKLIKFYEARMQVITDQYYATHLNSEISYRYNPNDPPEARALTLKIITADYYERKAKASTSKLTVPAPQDADKQLSRYYRSILPQIIAIEPGKNSISYLGVRHRHYLMNYAEEHPEEAKRVVTDDYCVAGAATKSSESLTRNMFCLSNLKACQHMTEGEMKRFIKKISAAPENPDDPEQVAAARQQNLEGLRIFMDFMTRQVNYLERKYGQGFNVISPEEIRDHIAEFDMDFTNLQGFTSLMKYCAEFPEIFKKEDELTLKKLEFYDGTVLASAGGALQFKLMHNLTLAEQKENQATGVADMRGMLESERIMKDTRTTIDWTATFSGEAASAIEIAQFLTMPASFAEMKKKFRETHSEKEAIRWYNLVPGMEALGADSDTVAQQLVADEVAREKAASLEEWRADEIGEEVHEQMYIAEHAEAISAYLKDRQPTDPEAAAALAEFRTSFDKIAQAAREKAGARANG